MLNLAKPFVLPDRYPELVAVEEELASEFHLREMHYRLVEDRCPPGVSARKSPEFFALLVAHRKWQFAVEKRQRVGSRRRA